MEQFVDLKTCRIEKNSFFTEVYPKYGDTPITRFNLCFTDEQIKQILRHMNHAYICGFHRGEHNKTLEIKKILNII